MKQIRETTLQNLEGLRRLALGMPMKLDKEKFLEMANSGMSPKDISNALGCSRGYVHRLCLKFGVKTFIKMQHERLVPIILEEFARVPILRHVERVSGASRGVVKRVLKKHGIDPVDRIEHLKSKSGELSYSWKGGETLSFGYKLIKQPRGRYKPQHRIVAEQMLGRPLTKKEVVHHKNGNKMDNRSENLQVLPSQSEHAKLHRAQEKIEKAYSLRKAISRYECE